MDTPPDGSAGGSVGRRLVVTGRVQGVFFRASTREVARRHDVRGWVANRADGSVEVWCEGARPAVAEVVDWVRAGGPPGAEVTDVAVVAVEPVGHAGFDVVHR